MSSPLILSCLFVAMLWLAAIMQFAVVRDRTIYDSRRGTSHRWLIVGGLTGLAARFSYLVIDVGYLPIPWPTLASMALFALGSIGLAMEKLFDSNLFRVRSESGKPSLLSTPKRRRSDLEYTSRRAD